MTDCSLYLCSSDLMAPDRKALSSKWIVTAAEDSLRRLRTERIDLYLTHRPDTDTPVDETLRAYEQLSALGKVRSIGSSNLDAAQLREALAVASDKDLPRYEVQQIGRAPGGESVCQYW